MQETIYKVNIPVSAAFLADTHNTNPNEIIESLKNHPVDIILITGDIVIGEIPPGNELVTKYEENVLPLLEECAKIAPTFLSWGNHEYFLCEQDRENIKNTGVTILDNEWAEYKNILIGGLTPVKTYVYQALLRQHETKGRTHKLVYPRLTTKGEIKFQEYELAASPRLDWIDEQESSDKYKLLLCHHPEYWEFLQNEKVDLILSGHAHGGQWRLGKQGLFAPGQGWFPKLTSGIIENKMIISRGLSNPVNAPRINNPEEIIYITPNNP